MRLVIEDAAGTRSSVPFTGDEITVGRAAEGVTFRLADRNVSRQHARFALSGGAVFVEDLGSLTGTLVNGERISGRRRLRAGDLVQIGDYDLAITADEEGAPGEPSPPPLPLQGPPRPAPAPAAPAYAVPASLPPVAPAAPGRPRTARKVVVAGLLALALGAAAGWAVGCATDPATDAPTPSATR
jgi:predicted component of type VI protein secretion system